ncbi:hypothetical protein FRB94_000468 [Tulasnella sp. JGI-2019a]|nr:hypothetical protein FRB94_000468 [Tulasnella sp. JGI-2019a]KAG9010361.1 hypothetical protein FRB93_004200 [Tulasnella sp. JGI-2019a]KAG9038653.1 hypothetical protein FRB95_000242 [Tulasnella sp. JGI-2019a]
MVRNPNSSNAHPRTPSLAPVPSLTSGSTLALIDWQRTFNNSIPLLSIAEMLRPQPATMNMRPELLNFDRMEAAEYPKKLGPGTTFWRLDGDLRLFSPLTIWIADAAFFVQLFEGRVDFWDGATTAPLGEFFFQYGQLTDTGATPLQARASDPSDTSNVIQAAVQADSLRMILLDARSNPPSEQSGMGPSRILAVICPFSVPQTTQWSITWRLTVGTAAASARRHSLVQ